MPKLKKKSLPGPINSLPAEILLDITSFIGSSEGASETTKNVISFFKTNKVMNELSRSIHGKKTVRDSSLRTIPVLKQSLPKLQENSNHRISSFNTKVDHKASKLLTAAKCLIALSALIMVFFSLSLIFIRERRVKQNDLNFLLIHAALLTSVLAVTAIFIRYPSAWITKKTFTFFEQKELEKASSQIEEYVQKEKELTEQLEQYRLGK